MIYYYHYLFLSIEGEGNIKMHRGMKLNKPVYVKGFYLGYLKKLLTIEEYMLIFIFFSRILATFVSSFFSHISYPMFIFVYVSISTNMLPRSQTALKHSKNNVITYQNILNFMLD